MVLDCSVTLPWYFEDEKTDFAESLLDRVADTELWVPALWRLEFANALLTDIRGIETNIMRMLSEVTGGAPAS
ncbi:MAG: type II toxin-antitoxin system VapC family toxin [Pseudomonadota bacterium]